MITVVHSSSDIPSIGTNNQNQSSPSASNNRWDDEFNNEHTLYTNYIFRRETNNGQSAAGGGGGRRKKKNRQAATDSVNDSLIFTPTKVEVVEPPTISNSFAFALNQSKVEPTRNLFERNRKEFYHVLDRVVPSLFKINDTQSMLTTCNITLIASSSRIMVVMVEKNSFTNSNTIGTENTEIPFMLFKWKHSADPLPQFKRLEGMEKLIQKGYQPIEGKPFNTIVQIECFELSTVYLTSDGRVYTDWEELSPSVDKVKDPKTGALIGAQLDISSSEYHAEKIATGKAHALVLLRERLTGKRVVLGFGQSEHYQIGGNSSLVKNPQLIHILSKSSRDQVVDMKCGAGFSVFLTLKGNLYVSGDNTFQQTGKKKSYVCIMDVMMVTSKEFSCGSDDRIAEVGCGEYFTVLITNRGRVFTTIQNIGSRKLTKQDEIGFYELDYFKQANIQIRHAYVTSDAIILQSKNQLYYLQVQVNPGHSLIGRIVIVNETPKPILFDSLKQYSLHIFTSNSNPFIYVKKRGLSSHIDDFLNKLQKTVQHKQFSDLTII